MLHAGDFVPELSPSKILRSPNNAAWRHENFRGCLTSLVFFPNVSDATAAFASLWNDVVERFAAQHVQFVLIARDQEHDLKPWLDRNPLEGWLLIDAQQDIASAYGIVLPQIVYIDRDARVLGFSRSPLPLSGEVEEALAGRPGTRLSVKPFSPGGEKPDLPPSYTVHISPTRRTQEEGTSSSSGPDHCTLLGFELKAILARVYQMDESRIDLPSALENGQRYDVAALLPHEESPETIIHRLQEALERHFHVTVERENRSLDVLVVTAPNGKGPGLREAEFGGGGFLNTSFAWTSSGGTLPSLADLQRAQAPLSHISGYGMGIADLCRTLEMNVGRPVMDETGLEGNYDFEVAGSETSNDDILQTLRENLGLVLTPAKRDVAILRVRARA
ncbi:MAG TPA: TIGR03435 family protein [Bryobacteraceae bacterium]